MLSPFGLSASQQKKSKENTTATKEFEDFFFKKKKEWDDSHPRPTSLFATGVCEIYGIFFLLWKT
jgi:hypothetical protein